ncbi:hypothetical protein AXF42_Ash021046 [Apostasia shenzhenica]|uniref:Uncharacterized protein n=1 Tax=Apostasia shenzhenica TaxID=1088818 RepID=A0A2H9ZZF3_9ASPA|nr:hypothetical protein AXF42_Ash021046 [Apostasia shenzhenica]
MSLATEQSCGCRDLVEREGDLPLSPSSRSSSRATLRDRRRLRVAARRLTVAAWPHEATGDCAGWRGCRDQYNIPETKVLILLSSASMTLMFFPCSEMQKHPRRVEDYAFIHPVPNWWCSHLATEQEHDRCSEVDLHQALGISHWLGEPDQEWRMLGTAASARCKRAMMKAQHDHMNKYKWWN